MINSSADIITFYGAMGILESKTNCRYNQVNTAWDNNTFHCILKLQNQDSNQTGKMMRRSDRHIESKSYKLYYKLTTSISLILILLQKGSSSHLPIPEKKHFKIKRQNHRSAIDALNSSDTMQRRHYRKFNFTLGFNNIIQHDKRVFQKLEVGFQTNKLLLRNTAYLRATR